MRSDTHGSFFDDFGFGKSSSSQEHARIMNAMSNFYTSATEVLRRELVSYGAVISNMANAAQKYRVEIPTIAKALMSLEPLS